MHLQRVHGTHIWLQARSGPASWKQEGVRVIFISGRVIFIQICSNTGLGGNEDNYERTEDNSARVAQRPVACRLGWPRS